MSNQGVPRELGVRLRGWLWSLALEVSILSLPKACLRYQHLPCDLSLEPEYVWAFDP